MSRHEGVSCDSCTKNNFGGRRYKCLICYDYDLCASCYDAEATTSRHLLEHPMQCILTRMDFDLYYGGESIRGYQPQAFTCPYCGKTGFSEMTLLEHVVNEHAECSNEVVCPVCASLPLSDPNLLTDELANHLAQDHRIPGLEFMSFLEERSMRNHGLQRRSAVATSRGTSTRNRRSNTNFGSSAGLASIETFSRDGGDPIVEFLSQLSTTRHASTSSQLQLQFQLQLERQQIRAATQQMERIPKRISTSHHLAQILPPSVSSSLLVGQSGSSRQLAQAVVSRPLLRSDLEPPQLESDQEKAELEKADHIIFARELVLAALFGRDPQETDIEL